MKFVKVFILVVLFLVCKSIVAQEHGIVGGASYGMYKKTGYYPIEVDNGKFNYVFGYQLRMPVREKIGLDFALLFGNQKVDISPSFSVDGSSMDVITTLNPKYFSFDVICHYEIFNRFRVGLGVAPSIYFDWGGTEKNSKNNAFDLPIAGKISYSFNYFDVQLSYKHGLFSIFNNDKIESLKDRNIQFSIFVPFSCRKK